MKKIGIITIHDIYNYGSVFQAYATLAYVREMGYQAELIDYRYPNVFHRQKNTKSEILSFGNRLLKNMLPDKPYLKYKNSYQTFKEQFYKLSAQSYPTIDSLITNPPDYDIYMAGSDQIWRPNTMKGDPCFFLNFAINAKKISYASSFGCNVIPEEYRQQYATALNQFSHLSVREKQGVAMIKNLTGRKTEVVLDPTLLLNRDEWLKVASPYEIKDPYILCYGLDTKDKYMENLALYIQKLTGLKVMRLNGKFYDYFDKKIHYILDAGPQHWLSLFDHASFILAKSFHATAFAINFNKPFLSILTGKKDHDSRQKHLLELLGLENRKITVGDKFPEMSVLDLSSDDYSHPIERLKAEKMKSEEYLKNAIEN
jgi:hypothetical protein